MTDVHALKIYKIIKLTLQIFLKRVLVIRFDVIAESNDYFRVADVRDFFKVFGDLRDVYLPKDYYTKESKGVCYVE